MLLINLKLQDVEYIVVKFIEIGGDHLDRIMGKTFEDLDLSTQ